MISPPPSAGIHADKVTRLVQLATLFYLAFVVYGSLVPLDFRPVELSAAIERFRNVPFLDLGIGSRADWVANLLLFIPLSYLLLANVWTSHRTSNVIASMVIVAICAGLSVVIEFLQIFFPPRTVSQNDILAETLGGMLGVVAFWFWGQRSMAWLASWQAARGASNLAEKLLGLYLFLFVGYSILPLDLTISLVEIYQKWSQGRLNLIPFAATPTDPVFFLYEIVTDALLWAPVSLLLALSGRVSRSQAIVWTVAIAGLLELLQVFVWTRVTDVTDLVTAVPGALFGGWLATRLRPGIGATAPRPRRGISRAWPIVVGILAWWLLLALIFWYPFELSHDKALARRGIDALFQVPFVAYYFGTELRAITEVFKKVGFFLPLGVMLAWLRWTLGHHGPVAGRDAFPLLLLLLPPLVIELGQLALVDKHVGSTDLVLEWFGGAIGYLGLVFVVRRWEALGDGPVSASASGQGSSAGPARQAFPNQQTPIRAGRFGRSHNQVGYQRAPDPTPYAVTASIWAVLVLGVALVPVTSYSVLPNASWGRAADGLLVPIWAIVVAAAIVAVSLAVARRPPGSVLSFTPRMPLIVAGFAVLCVALIPAAPEATIIDAIANGFGNPLQRLYALLKAVILWVPLGVIGSIAGVAAVLGRWGTAGAVTFVAVGLPLILSAPAGDAYEVVAAPLGIALGIWLGADLSNKWAQWAAAPREAAVPTGLAAATTQGSRPVTAGAPSDAAPDPPRTPLEGTRETGPPAPTGPASIGRGRLSLRQALSLGLLLPALIWAWGFPAVGPVLGGSLLVYYLVAVRFPVAVLVTVPLALPALDLAPWTGRLFIEEFDLVLWVSLAVALWHWPSGRSRARSPRTIRYSALIFGLSCLGAVLIGLFPLAEIDQNAFNSYRSQYNALRIGKGFLWAALLAWLLYRLPLRREWLPAILTGTSLGLVTVGLVTLWERALFASLWDFSIDYRVMATFSSMHVGGAHIEAYTVLAMPLTAHLLRTTTKSWQWALAAVALVLGSYVLVSTVARGALLGLAAAALTYGIGLWLQRAKHGSGSTSRKLAAAAASIVAAAVLMVGIGGVYFQERLGRSFEDLQTRLDHWAVAVDIMDDGLATAVFGMGLGQFPQTYLLRARAETPPGTYRFMTAGDKTFLALGAGETLYVTQRVAVREDTRYTLTLRVRSASGPARLNTTLCEKHLSHSRRCVWPGVKVPGDGRWHLLMLPIDSGNVGAGLFPARAPVDFALYNPTDGVVVMVDDLQLSGPGGNQLLRNGRFDEGGDRWFIKTHEHLSWHVKNLWVATYFDQGLIGALLFTLLSLVIIAELVRGVRADSRFALAALAGLVGFLAIGLVGSLFDAPRLTLLYFGLAALGLRHIARERRHA